MLLIVLITRFSDGIGRIFEWTQQKNVYSHMVIPQILLPSCASE